MFVIDNQQIYYEKRKIFLEGFWTKLRSGCKRKSRRISEIHEGDILCFKNAGAYCFSMASNYNSRLKPAEVLWKDGKGHLIRERETFECILKNQILIEA